MPQHVGQKVVAFLQPMEDLVDGVQRRVDGALEPLLRGAKLARDVSKVQVPDDEDVDITFAGPFDIGLFVQGAAVRTEDQGCLDAFELREATSNLARDSDRLRHNRAHFFKKRVLSVGLEEYDVSLPGATNQSLTLESQELPADGRYRVLKNSLELALVVATLEIGEHKSQNIASRPRSANEGCNH